MISLIKDFERMLHKSLVYYPKSTENVAGTFKVLLPEIYYDKFRELNEKQKAVISKFINIFLRNIFEIEKYNNKFLEEGVLSFTKDKKFLLNRKNIISYIIDFYGDAIDPYTDIKIIEEVPHLAEVMNNTQSKKFLPKNRLPITKIAFKNELGLKFYKIKFFV